MLRRTDHDAPTVQEWSPQFQGRGIKGYGSKLQENIRFQKFQVLSVLYQPNHRAMLNADTFGASSGTRCVTDIGQVVSCCQRRKILIVGPIVKNRQSVEADELRVMFRQTLDQRLLSQQH